MLYDIMEKKGAEMMLDELKTFITVVEQQSFTKASQILNFTQPTVSQQIKKLELHFNTILLERKDASKNFKMTKAGEVVYNYGKDMLDMMEKMMEAVDDCKKSDKRHLYIGSSTTIGNHLVPEFVKIYCHRYPEITVHTYTEDSKTMYEWLKKGTVSIAFIEDTRIQGGLRRVEFYTDDLILVGAPKYGDAYVDSKPSNLEKFPWVLREDGSNARKVQNKFLQTNNIRVEQFIECSSNFTTRKFMQEGMGISLVSRMIVSEDIKEGKLVELPLNKKFTRPLSYVVSDFKVLDKKVDNFIQIVHEMREQLENRFADEKK